MRGTLTRILILLCGTAGNALLAFAMQFILVRGLSVADYGRLAALMAAVNLATPLANGGIDSFWLHLFGKNGWGALRWVAPTMRACALTTAFAVLVLTGYIITHGFDSSPGPLWIATLAAPILLGQSLTEITAARLQLEERYRLLALWQMLVPLGRVLVVVVVFAAGLHELAPILTGHALVGVLLAAISVVSADQVRRGHIRLVGHDRSAETQTSIPGVWSAFTGAYPYAMVTIFYLIYSQCLVILVENSLGPEMAANYNAAYLVVSAIYLIPNVIYQKYLAPKIFRWWSQDRKMFSAVFHVGVAAHFVVGILLMMTINVIAQPVITLLFGERYTSAAHILTILSFAIPIRFVQHAYGSVFSPREHISRKIRYMGAAAASIGTSFFLMPYWGVDGAAISAITAELLLLLFYAWGVARHIPGLDVRATFRPSALRAALAHISGADRAPR